MTESEKIENFCNMYNFTKLEKELTGLALDYTVESAKILMERSKELASDIRQDSAKLSVLKCESFCADIGCSLEVQAYIEELCMWKNSRVYEHIQNMIYCAKQIEAEVKHNYINKS